MLRPVNSWLPQARVKLVLKLILSLSFLILVLSRLDLTQLLRVVAGARPEFLLLAVSIQILTLLLSALRWRIVLENFSIYQRWYPLTKLVFIGAFFNLFLPSAIGGDVFRAYYLSKGTGRGMSTTLTTSMLERSGGLCGLLLIGLAASLVVPQKIAGLSSLHIFLAACAVYAVANVMLFHSWTHGRMTCMLQRFGFHSLTRKMELVYQGLDTLKRNPGKMASVAVVSLPIQAGAVAVVWVTAQGIGIEAPFSLFMVFVPLINLTIMVPLTINGIGLRESAYYLLFSQAGVPAEMSVTLSLLGFEVMMLSSLPGIVYYSIRKQAETDLEPAAVARED